MSFYSGQDGGGVGVSMSLLQAILTNERACAADTTSMGHSDYSFKPVKPIKVTSTAGASTPSILKWAIISIGRKMIASATMNNPSAAY